MLDVADEGSYYLDDVLIENLNEKKAAKYRNLFLGLSLNFDNYKNVREMFLYHLLSGVSRKENRISR